MKIVEIKLPVFEMSIHRAVTEVIEFGAPQRRRYKAAFPTGGNVSVH
ncbi:MAG: hypothetical protein HN926_01035 [Chloroflexi bacterium]|jgi:hypothetical protein|nr:hypothetical protein [Chloroflexota bacterium]NCG40402.1 hypothetical protein [Actinomycetota bacterium]MBT3864107.1 hypothetical protein [Chloroflexota bacterium]MBT4143402.1 hypothetical protein [Chloroflexota bacterium]MBT4340628.1 hypothetical protein [Chloroflexota bacterium]